MARGMSADFCLICTKPCASAPYTCTHMTHDHCLLDRIYNTREVCLTCPICQQPRRVEVPLISNMIHHRLQQMVHRWSQLKNHQHGIVTQEMEVLHLRLQSVGQEAAEMYQKRETLNEAVQALDQKLQVLVSTIQLLSPVVFPQSEVHQKRLDTIEICLDRVKEAFTAVERKCYHLKMQIVCDREKLNALQNSGCIGANPPHIIEQGMVSNVEQRHMESGIRFLQNVQRRGKKCISRFQEEGCQGCGFGQCERVDDDTQLSLCTACRDYYCQPRKKPPVGTTDRQHSLDRRDQYILSLLHIPL